MARQQEEPYKRCRCGTGKVYTSERGKIRNYTMADGTVVCSSCGAQDILTGLRNKVRSGNS